MGKSNSSRLEEGCKKSRQCRETQVERTCGETEGEMKNKAGKRNNATKCSMFIIEIKLIRPAGEHRGN